MASTTILNPRDNASFAVSSRLLSCFVTEGILLAYYIPTPETRSIAGTIIILSPSISSHPERTIAAKDVYCLISLRNPPVFLDGPSTKYGRRVGLVDPLDMLPGVVEPISNPSGGSDFPIEIIFRYFRGTGFDFSNCSLREIRDPRTLWNKFAEAASFEQQMKEVIGKELDSSFYHQYLAYVNPPRCPSLDASPMEFEQSLVAGHPTHPMHRARLIPSGLKDYDWYRPTVRFAQVAKNQLDIQGDFPAIMAALVTEAARHANITLDHDQFIYVPVHELQVSNIAKMFPTTRILPEAVSTKAYAQSSIRTVNVAELPTFALKLAVGVKISSSLRTISHFTADFGPRFSRDIVPRLAIDRDILAVELEPHSAVHRHKNPEVQKHFTAVLRQEYKAAADETIIVCAALLECGHSNTAPGVSAVEHIFGLDTESKRIQFLDRYIELSAKALVPTLVSNGVAFEAHAQNLLVRVNKYTGTLLGFVIRDLGGLRIHPATLRQSTGVDFQFLPEHVVAAGTLEEVYPKFYHTYVHNHISRLVRLLGLHANGIGWDILRRHMSTVTPAAHPLWKLWLSPESRLVESKCLMRMRMRDSYRNNVYNPYPNMFQFHPETIGGRRHASL